MQFRLTPLVTVAFAILAAATPTRRNDSNQCNSGSLECCQSVQTASSSSAAALLGLLGVVVGDVNALVGLTCSPITVVGASGTSCSAQSVCCTNNSFNGVIALGCTPVNINA